MFDLPLIQLSETVRSGTGQYFSESVASFGLLLTILMGLRSAPQQIPILVGLYITAAYWFDVLNQLCRPAVTIARSLSLIHLQAFAPSDVPMFILCQILGALRAACFCALCDPGSSALLEPASLKPAPCARRRRSCLGRGGLGQRAEMLLYFKDLSITLFTFRNEARVCLGRRACADDEPFENSPQDPYISIS